MSTRSPTIKRILREAAEISNSPSPDYDAQPLETDLFEWHFTLRGPPNSVYSEGIYHGRIVLPPTYPLRPPMFRFTTPNGRFEANREICLSISGHHEETWQPAWGVRTALVALRSFMETEARGQLGGLEATDDVRQRLAKQSGAWTCAICAKPNTEIIKACEARSEETENRIAEVAIPQELAMTWKGDLQAKNPTDDGSLQVKREENCDLAEGFVQTVPQAPSSASLAAPFKSPVASNHNTAQNDVSFQPHGRPISATNDQAPDEATSLWIDRAIVVLIVLLTALLIKLFLGL